MPNKLSDGDRRDICESYLAGESGVNLASRYNVGSATITRVLRDGGIPRSRKRPGMRRCELMGDQILALYADGIGYKGVADRLGLGSTAVYRFLVANGIKIRNRSEQQKARMDRATPDEIAQLTSAAHKAATGRPQTWDERCKRAKTREGKIAGISQAEIDLREGLISYGLTVNIQTAIGAYNSDLTCGTVAVEVWGGGWHWYGEHREIVDRRFRYFLDHGWNIIVVPITTYWPLSAEVISYLAGLIQELSSNPPAISEYRVIWGAGQFKIVGSANDDKIRIGKPICNPSDTPKWIDVS